MSSWEYYSIWTDYRKVMLISDEAYFLVEHWSSDVNNKPLPLNGALYPKISQLGVDNWEMVETKENTLTYGSENNQRKVYFYFLFRRPVGRKTMTKWEYCRIYHVKVSETFLSIKMKCIIEFFKPDGKNIIQDASSQNVHSVAAVLALDGWEVISWKPPTLEHQLADKSGDILMKRFVS